jgi:hypothetical protein
MTRFRPIWLILLVTWGVPACAAWGEEPTGPVEISGRYPHLAMFNHQGECGTGAVVPWADRLWVITYAPHLPRGSDDKLYEIDAALNRTTRPESVGGTPADRMIHRESNQLIIGPYLIDANRNVRVVPPSRMPGRLTAVARHLQDPANKVYVYDMEGALYELDVHTLAVRKLFNRVAPGAHGKGAYTSQGRLVIANNGNDIVNKAKPAADDPGYASDREAAGCLAEWNGKNWAVVQRRQFTDVTGPGGIEGAPDEKSPLWALGWDKRSVILALLQDGKWMNFRLPVADFSYVAKHGWYTEWPRIREVAPGKLLLNMHGGWFQFPKSFAIGQTGGIRPIGDYLKITGDFCGWQGRIVFGCDDASIMQNPLLGQSQSNLWFTTWDGLSHCGRPSGSGGPWVDDAVKANEPSDPYLFSGYTQRVAHLSHDSDRAVTFTFEIDAEGHGKWTPYQSITVPPHGYAWHVFPKNLAGEWIRVRTNVDCPKATVCFNYGPGGGAAEEPALFAALPDASDKPAPVGPTVRPLGKDCGTLLVEATTPAANAKNAAELFPDLTFRPFTGAMPNEPTNRGAAADYQVTMDEASIIVTQAKHRYRLPVSGRAGDGLDAGGAPIRHLREVVTERFLLNAGGSFYMVPRPTAGGAERIQPVCTHDKRIGDFCSWRGLMVLAGTRPDAKPDGHAFVPGNGSAGVWLGDIDDLWKMGKPRGQGGPWLRTAVKPGEPSDPYLMAGYDQKTLELSHDSAGPVRFDVEVDYRADGTWRPYHIFEVPPGKPMTYEFPTGYSAHWVRFQCDSACNATARLVYK